MKKIILIAILTISISSFSQNRFGAFAGAKAVGAIAGTIAVGSGGTGAPVAAGVVIAASVVVGAGASIAAGVKINDATSKKTPNKSNNSFGKKLFIQNLDVKYPIKYSYLSEVGKLHNIEVNNFFTKKHSNKSSSNDILNSVEFNDINNKIQLSVNNYVDNDFNIEKFTDDLLEKELIDEKMKLVYDIFFDIYNNSSNSKNIQDIVNFYIEAIANTNVLSEDEKRNLIISFSVASESPFYWSNQN